MIKRLEDDWLAQPFYKYYMNENLRKRKIEHGRNRNRMWSDFLLNFAFYAVLMSPVTIFVNRFFKFSSTKVPTFFQYQLVLRQTLPFYKASIRTGSTQY
jgi:hypothetical protein